MPKRQKLKSAAPETSRQVIVHDRRSIDAPFNGRLAIVQIEDAYGIPDGVTWDYKRREWTSPGQPMVEVIRNVRDDPLGAMKESGQIDDVQCKAGRRWEEAYLTSEIGPLRAIDFTKEAVDGGRFAELTGERQAQALKDLARAARALGILGELLIRDVLASRMTLAMAADLRGLVSEADRKFLGRRFRECLDILASVFGLATMGRSVGK